LDSQAEVTEFDGLKDSMASAAKLYNWSMIIKTLNNIGIPVEEDVKNLIIGGNLQVLSELLKQIMNAETKLISLAHANRKQNAEQGIVLFIK
jgi:hypothetical protein